jgi:predicted nucleic acid-binding protein
VKREAESSDALHLWNSAEGVVTCAIARVEVRAAIARQLPEDKAQVARRTLSRLWSGVEWIPVSDELLDDGVAVAGRYRLRALDALHLAAARTVRGIVLATWDRELADAARRVAIHVVP